MQSEHIIHDKLSSHMDIDLQHLDSTEWMKTMITLNFFKL
jgi:hypothetical protein